MSKISSVFGLAGNILGIGGGDLKRRLARPIIASAAPASRKDPEVEAARRRQQTADRLRRGRRASILTSGRGVEDELGSVSRPSATGATLLGG